MPVTPKTDISKPGLLIPLIAIKEARDTSEVITKLLLSTLPLRSAAYAWLMDTTMESDITP